MARLCDVRFTSVRARINLSHVTVNTRTGDFNATSLAHVINTATVNKLVVQTWLDRAGNSHHLLPRPDSLQFFSGTEVNFGVLREPGSRAGSDERVSCRGSRCSLFALWNTDVRTEGSASCLQGRGLPSVDQLRCEKVAAVIIGQVAEHSHQLF